MLFVLIDVSYFFNHNPPMKYIVFIALLFAGIMSFSSQSYACSCMMPADPVTSMESSESVFAGKVTGISNDDMINMVEFDVNTRWKGADASNITIETAEQSATCGYNFSLGEEYLVYTYEKSDGTE